jgi:hypothetical protein
VLSIIYYRTTIFVSIVVIMAINIISTVQGLVEIVIQTVVTATVLQILNVRLVTGIMSCMMVTPALLDARMAHTQQFLKATVSLATVLVVTAGDLAHLTV